MKTDTVYKLAFNKMLDLMAEAGTGVVLPSESELGKRRNISRTTVCKVLQQMSERGIVGLQERGQRVVLGAGQSRARP